MSIQDMIKKSVLEAENFSNAIGIELFLNIVINMLVSVLIGYLIYRLYRKYYNGVIYSRTYGLTLVGMTTLTCMVTLAISTNIVISLGMVGALSIVRYRTAIKEPIDLLYMFWAITSGITVGAGMYLLALVGLTVMSLFIAVTFGRKSTTSAYILMVQYAGTETYDEILRELGRVKYRVKSKIFKNGIQELTLQITCSENKLMFVEKIQELTDVAQVSFVKYNGEYYG